MIPYLGELAAFGAVLCWTLGSQTTEVASRRVGSLPVNFLRLCVGFLVLAALLAVTGGFAWTLEFSSRAFLWLALSGFIGLFFGDVCLFRAFVEIGPRLSMLIMSVAAPLTAVLGYFFLGEHYSLGNCVGMAMTLTGVSWVILERGVETTSKRKPRHLTTWGLLLAIGGAVGQAVGTIFAKFGMGSDQSFTMAIVATEIRIIAAALAFLVMFTATGTWPRVRKAMSPSSGARGLIIFSGAFGTAIGVALTMVAIQNVETGIVATIIALVPVFLIPFAVWFYKEHVSPRAILGTLVAFAGIALLSYQQWMEYFGG